MKKLDTQKDRWLTVPEAAQYAGLSEGVMRDRIKDIPGAGRTLGATGDWRVKASAIDAFMSKAKKSAVPEDVADYLDRGVYEDKQ